MSISPINFNNFQQVLDIAKEQQTDPLLNELKLIDKKTPIVNLDSPIMPQTTEDFVRWQNNVDTSKPIVKKWK